MLSLLRSTVYVRITPDQLRLLHAESGHELSDTPAMAIQRRGGKSGVLAVGREALASTHLEQVMVANGFKHPRTLLADFTVAEQTLKQFLKQLLPHAWLAPSPVIVLHPQAVLEGGLTQIEIRAFVELGLGAGARKVFVWEGQELSIDDLRALDFSRAAGRLLHPSAEG